MKALVKEKPEPGIVLKDVSDPALLPGHVIVRVHSCGISGSEIAKYRWTNAYDAGRPKDMTRLLPRIMGHEFSGTIAAIGKESREGFRRRSCRGPECGGLRPLRIVRSWASEPLP